MHQSSSIGGGSYCLLNIIKALDKNKFKPLVALRSEGPLAEELRLLCVEVVIFHQMAAIPYNLGLLQRGSLWAYWNIKKSILALKMLLKKKHIDVLYLNNMMLCRYLQPGKECGCKTVIHVREHWPMHEHKRQLEWARQCVYNYADKMIAINHYSASIFPKKKSTIVFDWIDMSERNIIIPMETIIGEDCKDLKVILYTGGFNGMKGTYDVVRAFSESLKDDSYRLLVLGGKKVPLNNGLKHYIKCFLDKLGRPYINKRISYIIRNDKRIICHEGIYELKHIIEQSYCFVSYFKTPHANLALAENIVLGNACIAAKTEESMEYSVEGKAALLVEPNCYEEFRRSLSAFLADRERWKSAAIKHSKLISLMFDKKDNIQKLQSVLDSL